MEIMNCLQKHYTFQQTAIKRAEGIPTLRTVEMGSAQLSFSQKINSTNKSILT